MKQLRQIDLDFLKKQEAAYIRPLLLLAMLPEILLVKDLTGGIYLGMAAALGLLLFESICFFLARSLDAWLRYVAFLVLAVALALGTGTVLSLLLPVQAGQQVWLIAAEELTSFYLIEKLAGVRIKGQTADKPKEKEVQAEREATHWKGFLPSMLPHFEAATEYMLFLVLFGMVRNLLGMASAAAFLLSGGFLTAAFLLFFWKFSGTMEKEFEPWPKDALTVGMVLLILAGFMGLL
jgi:hypothetical protein